MPVFKNYNGEVINFPNHTHTVSATTGMVSSTQDGLMAASDKTELDSSYDQSFEMLTRLKAILYVRDASRAINLIDGATFNKSLKAVGPNATTITFTKNVIPSSKLSSAVLISNENNENKVYMYLDGTTIYIAPERANDIIAAPAACAGMFMGMSKITTINLTNFQTTNILTMSNMFSGCTALTTINGLSAINMALITDTSNMFYNCTNLSGNITISNPNIKLFSNMFAGCSTATSAKFVVKYTNASTKVIAKNMIATKSASSNVILNGTITATVSNAQWTEWAGGSSYSITKGLTITPSGDLGTVTYSWRVYKIALKPSTASIVTTRILSTKTNNTVTIDEYKANGLEYSDYDFWSSYGYDGHDTLAGYVTITNKVSSGTETLIVYVGDEFARKYVPAV